MKIQIKRLQRKITITINKKRSKGLNFRRGEIVYLNRKNIKILRPNKRLDYTKLGLFKVLYILRVIIG